jgi:hypothetical protein
MLPFLKHINIVYIQQSEPIHVLWVETKISKWKIHIAYRLFD